LAENLAAKSIRMEKKIKLEAMNPYERRIIHAALSDYEGVKTESEGKEPNRYVVIVPNDKDEFSKPYNAGRNNDKKGGRNSRPSRNGGKRDFKGGKDRRSSSPAPAPRKKTITFGTFLGNSLKDNND
jgi:spoIIIJ-associated protein